MNQTSTTAWLSWLTCCCLWGLPSIAAAQQAKHTAEQIKFFENKIRPVLVAQCYRCHSQQAGKVEGSLRVDTADTLLLGGDSGPAVDLDDFTEGTLWKAINYQDGLEMPPQRPLPAHVIADFRQWLESGAADPRKLEYDPSPETVSDSDIEKGRDFWSYRRIVAPPLPQVQSTWPISSIDQFVAQGWQEHDLPQPSDADPNTVLRRLCFDLLGVPPTVDQVDWFLNEWAKDQQAAIAQTVDLMLASPKFGERWGRHWLDVVRYAESTGREVNATYPQAWRYRDYVIDSFNADKPYDQFLKEQLVGDLLPVRDDRQWSEHLIATGFLALGPKTLNERNRRQFTADLIDEQIDVTTRTILGVSVACARCHDHKYEAIAQTDYYALAGIFGNMETHFGFTGTRQNRNLSRLIELPAADVQSFDRHLTASEMKTIQQEIARLNSELETLQRELRQTRTKAGTDRPSVIQNQQQKQQMLNRLTTSIDSLQAELDSVDSQGNPLTLCMGVQPVADVKNSRLMARGEVDQLGDVVPRGFVRVLAENPPKIAADSSGRMEFANWVASRENPLTARVMANRIWLHLLGEGIVRTPEDFGVTGTAPTHPELLDFLAMRLVASQWSVKSLIREICNSRVYRMSSADNAIASQKDPENQYLWRVTPQRMDAEVLRDSMLQVSGELDTDRPAASLVAQAGQTQVGRGQQVEALIAQLINQRMQSNASDERNAAQMERRERVKNRVIEQAKQRIEQANNVRGVTINEQSVNQINKNRSIYLPVVRDLMPRVLELFDVAEPSMVIGDREQSNTATQALFLMNNEFVIQLSDAMARRVMAQQDSVQGQIQLIFKAGYSRAANDYEMELATQFVNDMTIDLRQQREAKTPVVETAQRKQASEKSKPQGERQPPARRGQVRTSASVRPEKLSNGNVTANDIPADRQRALSLLCQSILGSAEFRFRN